MKRARDLVCGTLGSLPLSLIGPDGTAVDWNLFSQPEPDVPRSVSMTLLFEDLFLHSVSWWRITAVGWHNRPVEVRRLDPQSVTVRQDMKVYATVAGNQGTREEWLPDDQLIRFDSPNDGILTAGARAIRACLALDAAALRNASGVPPLGWLSPVDADPEDDEIEQSVTTMQTAVRKRSFVYIPAALKFEQAGYNPEQLQMQEARQHAVLEIARLAGVDAEDLGVSTTSRTYFNSQDRTRVFVNTALAPLMRAVEDRLSMDDVTPHGYTAKFNLSDFAKADDSARATVASTLVDAGVVSKAEGRRYFDPSLPVDINVPDDQTAPEKEPSNA